MDQNYVRNFIERVIELTDLDFYDEIEGFDLDEEDIDLFFGDMRELGITLSSQKDTFSVFTSFFYYDLKKDDVKTGKYFEDDVEHDKKVYLEENLFRLYAKANILEYPISVTDDGHYMCPGYVSRVGCFDVPYAENLIIVFSKLLKNFVKLIEKSDDLKIIKTIAKQICLENGVYANDEDTIRIRNDVKIVFKNMESDSFQCIEKYYIGKEYFLFEFNNIKFASFAEPIKIFEQIYNACSIYEDINYGFDNNYLYLSIEGLQLIQPYFIDRGLFAKLEEDTLLMNSSQFINFASEKFRNVFYKNFNELILNQGDGPIIITEGATDWIHLKKHWISIKDKFQNTSISFYEYYPVSKKFEGKIQQNMGGSALVDMCKAFSKFPQSQLFIFIADRDDKKIIEEMSDGRNEYKKWGQNVYSMVLPTPTHRENCGEICIEHLYTDDELNQSFICKDGIERHLYLGKEFDEYGRSLFESKMCIKRNICGKNSNKIVDGGADARVISYDKNDTTNYALSKFDFAEKVKVDTKSKSYFAFIKVFDIVDKIIKDNYKGKAD